MRLTHTVNRAMLTEKPRGWMKHLKNYANCDMVLPDIFGGNLQGEVSTCDISTCPFPYCSALQPKISSVFLKLLSACGDHEYYVRPGQLLGREKFRGPR